jgi:hypothetical protein
MRADRTGPCFCVGEKEAPRPPFLLQATSTNKDPSIIPVPVCPRTRSRAHHAICCRRAQQWLAAARRPPTATATYPRPHRLRNPPRPITAPIAIPTFPARPPCCLDIHGLPVTADVSRLPPPARLPWAEAPLRREDTRCQVPTYTSSRLRSPLLARFLPSFLPLFSLEPGKCRRQRQPRTSQPSVIVHRLFVPVDYFTDCPGSSSSPSIPAH